MFKATFQIAICHMDAENIWKMPNISMIVLFTSHMSVSVCSCRGSMLDLTVPWKRIGSWGMILNLDRKSCNPKSIHSVYNYPSCRRFHNPKQGLDESRFPTPCPPYHSNFSFSRKCATYTFEHHGHVMFVLDLEIIHLNGSIPWPFFHWSIFFND